jgi:17beta-estradiol 17-dehydrogenase / very-long-chain 3-oxoacyl-CoA reductase
MHSDMFSVITGASDGIGREFALQLAKAGFNVLLAARNRDMLATLAEEIGTNTIYSWPYF